MKIHRKMVQSKVDNNLIFCVNVTNANDKHWFTSMGRAASMLGFNNPSFFYKKLPFNIETMKGTYMCMIVDGGNVLYKDINW